MTIEAAIEQMIADLVAVRDDFPEFFNDWEMDFLESVEEQNDHLHLTEKQLAVLGRLHEREC